MTGFLAELHPDLVGFVLTLSLSLLIGFERERERPDGPDVFFGGIRTFPLIALSGFLLVIAFEGTALPFAVGLVVLGALLAVSHSASLSDDPGLTTEIAALLTYALAAAAANRMYWISVTVGVVAVILLQEKRRLEGIAARVPRREVSTLAIFLLMSGVILPVVPDRAFTAFEVNPFHIWLVVVAVSGVSYLSYLLQLALDHGRGLLLAGVLGGAYSSTVTTVALARSSREGEGSPVAFAGAMVAATGMMYLRLWLLIRLFAPALAASLTVIFWALGLAALLAGAGMCRAGGGRRCQEGESREKDRPARNPLELTSALTFAGLFVGVLVITHLVAERFGGTGLLVMAGIMGAADVDPFILGLTQYAEHGLDLGTGALAVVVASASNNVVKGIYAVVFGSRKAGRLVLAILTLLAAASIGAFLLL